MKIFFVFLISIFVLGGILLISSSNYPINELPTQCQEYNVLWDNVSSMAG